MNPGRNDAPPNEILHLLQTEHEAMENLRQILDRETSLLTSGRDMEELSQLVLQKDLLIEELKVLALKREELFSLTDTSSANTDFESLLKDFKNSDTLLPLWQQLLSLTTTCQEINRMNGAIIKLNEQHIQQALLLLRNEEPADLNYDAKGSTSTSRRPRLLGQV